MSRARKLRTLLALGTIVGVGAVLTTAAFSDRVEMQTTFTAGSLDINVDGQDGNPLPFEMASWPGGTDMVPGETSVYSFTVNNTGSLPAEVWVETQQIVTGGSENPMNEVVVQAFEHDDTESCAVSDFANWDTESTTFNNALIEESEAFTIAPSGGSTRLCVGVHLPEDTTQSGGGSLDALFRFNAKS